MSRLPQGIFENGRLNLYINRNEYYKLTLCKARISIEIKTFLGWMVIGKV